MYDPWVPAIEPIASVTPRVATAPYIDRFNVRQDGDSAAICGPLKLAPDHSGGFDRRKILLKQLGKNLPDKGLREQVKIELVSASYGCDDRATRIAVTAKLLPHINGTRYLPIGAFNQVFGDPQPGVRKTLQVAYKINGSDVKHAEFDEDEDIILPP